jgi:hypothetical protein
MRSFSASPEPTPGLVWSAWLPEEASEASLHLTSAEATLASVHTGVPQAESRILEVLARGHTQAGRRTLTRDDAALLDEVSDLHDLNDLHELNDASFGLTAGGKERWRDASERALAAVKQVQAGIGSRGIVETHVGDALVGQTQAGLLGAERTVFRVDCTPEQLELHLRTVSLSLSSRVAMVSMLAAAVRAAARLSLALALPGGPLLLVPSVLRFISASASPKR